MGHLITPGHLDDVVSLVARVAAQTAGPLPDGDRAAGPAVLFHVALVVLLGPVERRRRGDLRDDRPPPRLLLGVACGDRGFLLGSVVEEDRRTVLAAEVEALAVAGGRIVDPPERLKQLLVADLGRVEPHLHCLGVAGAVPADLLVTGVWHMPAGVANRGLQHPVDLTEGRLDAPEASCGKGRALGPLRAVAFERRRGRRVGGVPVPELNHVVIPSTVMQRWASARDSGLGRLAEALACAH